VPTQDAPRFSKEWLTNKNMAGLIPAWTHLLQTAVVDTKHDWVINSELDHFMRPSMVRLAIASYLADLQNGTVTEKEASQPGKPLMLMFGNAFAFNRAMVKEMRKQWPHLQKVQPVTSKVSGCPAWMEKKWRGQVECSQDVVYPLMAAEEMNPPVPMFGNAGCGKFAKTASGHQFRLGCWEMLQSPSGHGTAEMQQEAIREIAQMPSIIFSNDTDTFHDATPILTSRAKASKDPKASLLLTDAAYTSASSEAPKWHVYYPGSQVPFIHNVGFASVMKLARELLGL
jgi:hypothetical protein